MNKESFIAKLKEKLTVLSQEERDAAIKYYEEYFDDAGVENEQAVINELGSVEKVVEGILKENNYVVETEKAQENTYRTTAQTTYVRTDADINYGLVAFLIIMAIFFFFPVILPILMILISLVFAFFIAGFCITIAGVAVSVVGFVTMFVAPFNGLLMLGAGMILLSLGIVFSVLVTMIGSKAIPAIVRGIVNVCRLPFRKRGM